ncbi:hypothetical protein PHMEG_00017489 [Phytophthora megakarya]|uniref:Retrotransposon gag domain-containing protein n=1 Tax=Phytophthora megakarya TaxID=4795 RepID=A0A225VYU8_9STRA|nr:hypothetical protein PHMEG_00017489 [Phytophthora megakarya]
MAFELSIQDGALHWYRQLPRKTHRKWKLLSNAFIKYCCSKFNPSAKARYYSAKREDKEHVCDYLNRLNGYACNVGVRFENGGCEAKDHVEHFLDTCDDRGLEEHPCHVRVKDIHDLEDMINDILKSRDRKSKRESSVRHSSGQDGGRRRDSGRNEDSRSNYRREERRRDESPYRPRITLAEALSDLVIALNETSVGSKTSQQAPYDQEYESNEDSFGDAERRDDDDRYSNRGSEYDYAGEDEHGHVAAANDHERRAAAEGTFARSDNRRPKSDDHFNSDRGFARDNRNGRAKCANKPMTPGNAKFSMNLLASSGRSPQIETGLIPIGLPQLAEPAVDADYLFAFAGEVKWPEDREMGFVNTTEIVEENDGSLGENEVGEVDAREHDGCLIEVSASSWGANETLSRSLVQTAKLLPGERLRWWSSQRYDKRDCAYVKFPTMAAAWKYEVLTLGCWRPDDELSLRITIGWKRVYEFEMWIMEHSACVDVVLGTDIMIPAEVRLDLFHGTARLPDEVTVPLVKSAGTADDEPGKPVWVRLTNVSDGTARCYKHSSVVLWIPKGELPREVGYVRLDWSKYNEWQVLAYAEGRDDTLLQKEKELYECRLAEQPPAVDRQEYTTPARILTRPVEVSVAPRKSALGHSGLEIEAEIATGDKGTDDDWYEHILNEMELADYAHELAFMPNLTEPSSTVLDYT